jgi:hypothetical protein
LQLILAFRRQTPAVRLHIGLPIPNWEEDWGFRDLRLDSLPTWQGRPTEFEATDPCPAVIRLNKVIMSSPAKSPPDVEQVGVQSGEDPDAQMNQDPHASGLGYEFEVKEQDRWLPIANG